MLRDRYDAVSIVIIGRYPPGRISQGEVKKELSARKVKIKFFSGSVESRFKSLLGRYRPESINQGEAKKKLSARKVRIEIV